MQTINQKNQRKQLYLDIELNIQLTDEIPVYQRPRRLSHMEKEIVDKQMNEWLEDGTIRPGNSDYASPVVVIPKKDGSYRVCIDYRKLSKKTIKDRYPTPIMEDVLDALQSSRVFSTIDLKNGYFHVAVNEKSQKYLSFITPMGQYIPLKTPFGCCNSPAVFHRYTYQRRFP